MIEFMILEDNKLHMKKTKEIIIKYMMHNDYEFIINEHYRFNEEFFKDIKTDNPIIYILDFEIEDTNAIDIARKIRKKDWNNPIIVLTVYEDMEYETLKQRLEIMGFVSKNKKTEKDLFELFDVCMDKFKIKKSFKFKIGKSYYNIDYDKILYIYKDTTKRKSVIVTDNYKYEVTMSLKQILEKLPNNFKYSHKACIINTKKISEINYSSRKIVFDNGSKIDLISKTYKEELRTV